VKKRMILDVDVLNNNGVGAGLVIKISIWETCLALISNELRLIGLC